VGHAELGQQLLVGGRLFERVELNAVDVLQQCVPQQRVVLGLPNDRGQPVQARLLGRAPAPLAHDQLVLVRADLADHDRLQQTELLDGVGQLGQCLFVEGAAGLLRVRRDRGRGQLAVARAGNRSSNAGRAVGTVGVDRGSTGDRVAITGGAGRRWPFRWRGGNQSSEPSAEAAFARVH